MVKRKNSEESSDYARRKKIKNANDPYVILKIPNFIHLASIFRNISSGVDEASIQLVDDKKIIVTSQMHGIVFYKGCVSCHVVSKSSPDFKPPVHSISLKDHNIKSLATHGTSAEIKLSLDYINIKVTSKEIMCASEYTFCSMISEQFDLEQIDNAFSIIKGDDIEVSGSYMWSVMESFKKQKPEFLKFKLYEECLNKEKRFLQISMNKNGGSRFKCTLGSCQEKKLIEKEEDELQVYLEQIENSKKTEAEKHFLSSTTVSGIFLKCMDGFSKIPTMSIKIPKSDGAPIWVKYTSFGEENTHEIFMMPSVDQ